MLSELQVAFTAVLGLSTLLSGVLTRVAARFRREVGADWFVATLGLVTLWNATTLATLFVHSPDLLVALEMATNVFSLCVPVVWFSFVVDYSGRGDRLTRRALAVLWAIPVLALVAIFTSPAHDLYYASPTILREGGWSVLVASPGPVAYLGAAYVYVLFAVGFRLLAGLISTQEQLFSGQAWWLLAGTVAPVGVGILNVAGVTPDGWPLISASMAVLALAYGYGLHRHRLLDLSPASRRIGVTEAFDDLDSGVVVVDTDWQVVAVNDRACEQFDREKSSVLGNSIDAVSPALRTTYGDAESRDLEVDGRVFEVAATTVDDVRGRPTGYALVVRDVTDQRGRKQRLHVLNRVLRHNLRNDMTVVSGYANEIARESDGTVAEMARRIDDTADELLGFSEKARDIERTLTAEEAVLRPVDVSELVDRILVDLQDAHPACDPDVDVDLPDHLTVRTDPHTLELVLWNIVENAVLHGVADGRTVSAEGVGEPDDTGTWGNAGAKHGLGTAGESDEGDWVGKGDQREQKEQGERGSPGQVRVQGRRTTEGVELTVSDGGPGIPSSELAAIEAETETALEHSQGLGLWLVRWGATRIGADVTFDACDGTTATLTIPNR